MGQVTVKKRMNVVVAKVGGQKEEEEKLPFCWLVLLRLTDASKKSNPSNGFLIPGLVYL